MLMARLEFDSKDLSRIMWHIENSQKTMSDSMYQIKYERLIEDFSKIGIPIPEIPNDELMIKNETEDERLKWKTQLLLELSYDEEEED
jgi:hypothetical protein